MGSFAFSRSVTQPSDRAARESHTFGCLTDCVSRALTHHSPPRPLLPPLCAALLQPVAHRCGLSCPSFAQPSIAAAASRLSLMSFLPQLCAAFCFSRSFIAPPFLCFAAELSYSAAWERRMGSFALSATYRSPAVSCR